MTDRDLSAATWHKSSFSGGGNNCVEVTTSFLATDGVVLTRDTKDPENTLARYTRSEWTAFLNGVRAGEFDI